MQAAIGEPGHWTLGRRYKYQIQWPISQHIFGCNVCNMQSRKSRRKNAFCIRRVSMNERFITWTMNVGHWLTGDLIAVGVHIISHCMYHINFAYEMFTFHFSLALFISHWPVNRECPDEKKHYVASNRCQFNLIKNFPKRSKKNS